jgi:hypothetical protein
MSEKEKNKLIERTCKYDAYQAAFLWGKHAAKEGEDHGSVLWYLIEKMNGHKEWLAKQEYRYAYGEGFIKNDGYYATIKSHEPYAAQKSHEPYAAHSADQCDDPTCNHY